MYPLFIYLSLYTPYCTIRWYDYYDNHYDDDHQDDEDDDDDDDDDEKNDYDYYYE